MIEKKTKSGGQPGQGTPVGIPVVQRGQLSYTHHLVKLEEAEYLRNISWKHRAPQIEPVKHCHWYHSVNDRNFTKNQYSTPSNGHFHEITFETSRDASGNEFITRIECGPALEMKEETIDGFDVTEKRAVPVVYDRHPRVGGPIEDDHTHPLKYMGSEEVSTDNRQALRNVAQAQVSKMFQPPMRAQDAKPLQTDDKASKASAGNQSADE
jgi:hypothetical protein